MVLAAVLVVDATIRGWNDTNFGISCFAWVAFFTDMVTIFWGAGVGVLLVEFLLWTPIETTAGISATTFVLLLTNFTSIFVSNFAEMSPQTSQFMGFWTKYNAKQATKYVMRAIFTLLTR